MIRLSIRGRSLTALKKRVLLVICWNLWNQQPVVGRALRKATVFHCPRSSQSPFIFFRRLGVFQGTVLNSVFSLYIILPRE